MDCNVCVFRGKIRNTEFCLSSPWNIQPLASSHSRCCFIVIILKTALTCISSMLPYCKHIVNKGLAISRPQPGWHLPNSPWPGIMYPIRVPGGLDKKVQEFRNFFFTVHSAIALVPGLGIVSDQNYSQIIPIKQLHCWWQYFHKAYAPKILSKLSVHCKKNLEIPGFSLTKPSWYWN